MKKFVYVLLAVTLLGGLVAGSFACKPEQAGAPSAPEAAAPKAKGAPIVLKWADMQPPATAAGKSFQWWAQEVERRTGGQVKVEFFWSASLVAAPEQLEAVKTNAVQITQLMPGYHPDAMPYLVLGNMPMLNTGSARQAMMVADEIKTTHPAFRQFFDSLNTHYLFSPYFGPVYLFSRVPLKSVSDLKGLRVRASAGHADALKEWGASVISLPAPEIYTALERGAIDATHFPGADAVVSGIHRVAKYILQTDIGGMNGPSQVMNVKAWNSLPADVQKVIGEVTREYIDEYVKIDAANYKDAMDKAQKEGAVMSQFSPSDVQWMIETSKKGVWEPYADKLDKKGLAGSEALKAILALNEKYKGR